MYLAMAPETFQRMDRDIKDKSWPELAINAHSLKPQADFMGISPLKELLIKIEDKAKSGHIEGIESLFTEAKSIHDESEVFLLEYINDNWLNE